MSPAGGELFFSGWATIGRTLLVGTLAYLALVILLRVSGKRTLSTMNAFDLVVTVALGSTLANILLSPDVALAEGVVGMGLLILLQWIIAWSSSRARAVAKLVKSEPRLLVLRGRWLHEAMQEERVLDAEILSAVRAQGIASLADVEAVVLETDGSFTVMGPSDGPPTALRTVKGFEPPRAEGAAPAREAPGPA